MPRLASSNLTRMAKSSPLLRRIASHDLFADKRLLELCRSRAVRYASDETIARLAAALPWADTGDNSEELEKTEEKDGNDVDEDQNKDNDGDDDRPLRKEEREKPDPSLPEILPLTPRTVEEQEEIAKTAIERFRKGTRTGFIRAPWAPPVQKPPKPPKPVQSSPEFFSNYSKTVFSHSFASQAWILCTNLSYYLDILDAAKFQALLYSAAWSELRHRYLPPGELLKTSPPPKDKNRPMSPGQVDIEIEEAEEIIAKYIPDMDEELEDEDEEEDEDEDEPEGEDENEYTREDVNQDIIRDGYRAEDGDKNDDDEPSFSDTKSSPSNASSRTIRRQSPTPTLEERRERFYQRNSIEAMVFRRLVEEFYQWGSNYKPVRFAHLMKLHLGLSRVSHQHQQQMSSISTIFRRQKLHPNRNLRARMRHDVAVVMKSGGMSSPLSESISVNEEWPDGWDIWPAKRRKIHGEGVQLPGTTPKNKAKSKSEEEYKEEEPFPSDVKW